ncbi:hypothetical protein BASA50_004028 [Batrachochytrium salamandrivorans]|uniref:Mitochondrial genome maintenance protein MGM101 n=1 Tax=Batrachochytrium salamandrivorans TaxID=1357716 RepID=A0ABQ8FH16_9FUNG|nr:hypothetical protein BASA60_010465 [Batrachochytrium salamandrivorans]KAH6573562.1 hypothetical protein BASA62_002900 [Batrachochytrium salamandrivorans]KAH6598146.1 hypothetical protein BASA50_004028 [Batrachochytrium salamandrivorans]KAH6601926.1 hypothetical protein BASA61_001629 [Batrachochytrium salamandrivorans]KAH9272419.1 hypothetical protein BASA83_005226 [Batrachochytrium salamandrivorans]
MSVNSAVKSTAQAVKAATATATSSPLQDIPAAWHRWTDGRSLYQTVSRYPLSAAATAVLAAPVLSSNLNIDPVRGWLYLKQEVYVKRLNEALGKGQWCLKPVGPVCLTASKNIIYRPFALLHNNRFISEAIGESVLASFPTKENAHSWCEYIALVRTCKDLGIASELWDPVFAKKIRSESFESTWVKDPNTGRNTKAWTFKK